MNLPSHPFSGPGWLYDECALKRDLTKEKKSPLKKIDHRLTVAPLYHDKLNIELMKSLII